MALAYLVAKFTAYAKPLVQRQLCVAVSIDRRTPSFSNTSTRSSFVSIPIQPGDLQPLYSPIERCPWTSLGLDQLVLAIPVYSPGRERKLSSANLQKYRSIIRLAPNHFEISDPDAIETILRAQTRLCPSTKVSTPVFLPVPTNSTGDTVATNAG